MFGRIVVMLDHLSPQKGAFSHALDWARRFDLPIHGVSAAAWNYTRGAYDETGAILETQEPSGTPAELHNPCLDPLAASQECARVCARFNVGWEMSSWQGRAASELHQVIRQDDLLVFGQALPQVPKKELLRETLLGSAPAVLLSSDTWTTPARVLLVDDGNHPAGGFLVKAAEMCGHLRGELIVLTLARAERAARLRQQAAREALAGSGIRADFDFIVGCETAAAVVSVARWRRCPLVVLAQRASTPWWRWSGGAAADWFVDLGESLSFLALPGKAFAHATSKLENSVPAAEVRAPASCWPVSVVDQTVGQSRHVDVYEAQRIGRGPGEER